MSEEQSTEAWLAIPGHEGVYEVSNRGSVRSVDRIVRTGHGGWRKATGRILKQWADVGGYMLVALSREGRQQNKRVHLAVLEAFVSPRPDGMEACHNDGDPANNSLANLRWDTPSANRFDTVRHGNHHYSRRDRCGYGHELVESNIYRPPGQPTKRKCRKCRASSSLRRREAAVA